jgi:endonuclease YncB( thermonuclease family)
MTTVVIVLLVLGFVWLVMDHAGRGRSGPVSGGEGVRSPEVVTPPARVHVALPVMVLHGTCHVVDGDTIRIRDVSIRLGGIDAPELDHPYGKNARWALFNLCKGMPIRAEVLESDHYGRVVARCFLPDGRDLAAEMVRMGHAVDWPKYSGGRYRNLEVPGIRKKLWRCDARQKGRMPMAG